MEGRSDFEELTLPYMNVLYRGAVGMTKNESDAEDLVQDTYLRAFKFFDTFKKGTNIKGWLFKILQNVYINRYRSDLRMPPMVDIEDRKVAEFLVASDNPEDEFFDNVIDEKVEEALNNLPVEFRLPIILHDLKGLTYKEIAEVAGCALGTVMSRLHRGRRLLCKELGNYAKERGYAQDPCLLVP